MLVPDRRDFTVIEQRDAIIQRAAVCKYAAHQHCWTAICGRQRQRIQLLRRACREFGFQHQIFGRITYQLLFRIDDQICAGCLCAPFQHRCGISGKIADALVNLGNGDGKLIGHCPHILRQTKGRKAIVILAVQR